MKKSYLLVLAAERLTPLILLLSLWVLYRGHNAPGGGFIGGLMAASALCLYALGLGPQATRRLIRVSPRKLMGFGLMVSLTAGLWGLSVGDPFLTGQWATLPLVGIPLGTPLLFDLGVYFTVIGVTVSILLDLEES